MAGHEARHCVHGEWMTVKEAAARLGVSWKTIHNWRFNHRHRDGMPALLEEAWDYYEGRASGAIPETRGREPVKYRYKGRLTTIPEVAERAGPARRADRRPAIARRQPSRAGDAGV